MNSNAPIVRFAPSPTGRLHIGNIRTAIFNWLITKKSNGKFILRMDDTDTKRATKEFANGIEQDLKWLGLKPDVVHRQSQRFDIYKKHTEHLKQRGLLYPCYESEQEIERRRKRLRARGLPPVYDRAALKLSEEEKVKLESEGKKPHWRFLLPNFETDVFKTKRTEIKWQDIMQGEKIVDLASLSDPVLIRADGSYLYTLPSVIDDMEMGVTHVIRGGDHITNTAVQIAIFKALSTNGEPPEFGHHNLLVTREGNPLTKREDSLSIESLRGAGIEPMAINSLSVLIGSAMAVEPCKNLAELGKTFDIKKISKSPAQFREDELKKLNEKFLHEMSFEVAKPKLEAMGIEATKKFWETVRPNISKIDECKEWQKIIKGDFKPLATASEDKDFIEQAKQILETINCEPENLWQQWSQELKAKTGRKGKDLFLPIRKALTAQPKGPEMPALLTLIGKQEALARLSIK